MRRRISHLVDSLVLSMFMGAAIGAVVGIAIGAIAVVVCSPQDHGVVASMLTEWSGTFAVMVLGGVAGAAIGGVIGGVEGAATFVFARIYIRRRLTVEEFAYETAGTLAVLNAILTAAITGAAFDLGSAGRPGWFSVALPVTLAVLSSVGAASTLGWVHAIDWPEGAPVAAIRRFHGATETDLSGTSDVAFDIRDTAEIPVVGVGCEEDEHPGPVRG